MNLIQKLELIKRVDALVRRKATGSPNKLAEKLGVSRRNIFLIINTMKDMGAPITFCRMRNSYCYEKEGVFSFGFILKGSEYKGGKSNNWDPSKSVRYLQHVTLCLYSNRL